MQNALELVGLDGQHADISSTVATAGKGWSQGEMQLVRCCFLALPVSPA